jgi:ribonuclease HII
VQGLNIPSLAVWKGDQVCASVAAASIVAKVTRDRLMRELHLDHPAYGFDVHKGYVTAMHREALLENGPCSAHRRSFAPVATAVAAVSNRAGNGLEPRICE